MTKTMRGLILTFAAGWGPWAAASERWIHVRVDEAEGDKGRVDIQVPVAMVSTLLPALKGRSGIGSIHVDGNAVDISDVRGYWNAVRAARDGEYVTIRDDDSHVRIAKSGDFLTVRVDDSGDSSRVRMKVPLKLVDAMLAGGDRLDLDAVAVALAKVPQGDLLTVDEKDSHVRIWIDDEPAPAREDQP